MDEGRQIGLDDVDKHIQPGQPWWKRSDPAERTLPRPRRDA